jgi:hypothetical protein
VAAAEVGDDATSLAERLPADSSIRAALVVTGSPSERLRASADRTGVELWRVPQ